MRPYVPLCVAACLALVGGPSAGIALRPAHAAEIRPLSVEDLRQALGVARLAARNGLQDLSFRAVRAALSAGPPISPLTFKPGQSSDPNQEQQTYQQHVNEIEASLAELSEEWARQKFDPQGAYETLAAVVLPEGRVTEVFLYPRTTLDESSGRNPSPTASAGSVGALLITWANRAGAVDRLQEQVQERAAAPRAKFDAQLLLVALAIERAEPGRALPELQGLEQAVKTAPSRSQAEAAGLVAVQALRHAPLQLAAVGVLEAAAQQLTASGRPDSSLEPVSTWLQTAALARLEAGDLDAAQRNYQSLQTIQDAHYSRYSGDYPVRMRQQLRQSIARDLLRHGHLLAAFQILGEQADLSVLENSAGVTASAATLARQLQRLSAQERYDFLAKFTLPTAPGAPVRMLTGFLPSDRPPAEFLASLDPKVRAAGFELLATTPEPHVFHSGAALLDAADACGKLPELTARLEQLRAANAPQADVLLLLAALRGADAPRQREALAARVAWVNDVNQAQPKTGAQLKAVPLDDFVAALYALRHPELRDVGLQLVRGCLAHSKRLQQRQARAIIELVEAAALQQQFGEAPAAAGPWPRWQDWRAVGYETAGDLSDGAAPNRWCSDNGLLRCVTSEAESALYFRYPLVGDFSFAATVSEGNWSEGSLLYGGLHWGTYRYNNSIFARAAGRTGGREGPAAVLRDQAFDNDGRLEIRQGRVQYFVNGYPVLNADCGAACPFLGFRSTSGWTPIYRSIRLSGSPQIPREVALLQDQRLLGWSPTYYRESAPNVFDATSPASAAPDASVDWTFHADELRAEHRAAPLAVGSNPTPRESLLFYQRPLWDGDRIRYEFYYDPGHVGVHPALDRLAFVFTPDAVRLHWLTEGAGDWTGLRADNLVDDPAGQRHSGPLPLRPRDWNEVLLAVDAGTVALHLNGAAVYQRALPPDAARRFGFYRDRTAESVRVRKAILTGDWPETLPPELQRSLFARVEPLTPAQTRTSQALIDEEYLSRDVLQVLRDARRLPPPERFDFLRRWVLPDVGGVRVRLRGEFVAGHDPLAAGAPPHVVAPALDLVETAKELGRLVELREQVASLPAEDPDAERARLALLALIDLARNSTAEAAAELKELGQRLAASDATVEWRRWPEILAASRAIASSESSPQGQLLLDWIVEQQINTGRTSGWRFDQRLRVLRGHARALALLGPEPVGASLTQWLPVTHAKADIVALGLPTAVWMRTPAGLQHVRGHEDDFVYFRSPLRGDFEVDAELSTFGYREITVMYGGRRIGLTYKKNEISYGEFTTPLPPRKLSETIPAANGWAPYKLISRNGRLVVQVGGKTVYDEPLPADADPWFAFCAAAGAYGDLRHVTIRGTPRIPEELALTAAGNLHGWIASYYRAATSGDNPDWRQEGPQLIGPHRPDLAGVGRESLLQYHRPLAEDGVLTYRFRYVPGQAHVHPALGSTVFVLDPDGVRLHQLTAGQYETAPLSPTNLTPTDASGPLPLQPNADNALELSLKGATVALALNGQRIYEGELSADNSRLFGLFHWPGESEVRVQDVVYRGDWPKQLPPVAEQELARVAESFQTPDRQRLPQVWRHDFAQSGLGKNLFTGRGARQEQNIQSTPEGVVTRLTGGDGWSESGLTLRQEVAGDFDLEVAFDDLQMESPASGSLAAALQLEFDSRLAEITRVGRREKSDGESVVEAMSSYTTLEGKKSFPTHDLPLQINAGSFRAVRRGPAVHYFIRGEHDAEWRFVQTVLIGRAADRLKSIVLQASVNQAKDKQVSVRWKSLTLYAEQLPPR